MNDLMRNEKARCDALGIDPPGSENWTEDEWDDWDRLDSVTVKMPPKADPLDELEGCCRCGGATLPTQLICGDCYRETLCEVRSEFDDDEGDMQRLQDRARRHSGQREPY